MRSTGNNDVICVDESRFQDKNKMAVITALLRETKTSMACLSTQAPAYESAVEKMMNRCWNDDPKQGRVVQTIQLDSMGRLVTQPIASDETMVQLWKQELAKRIIENQSTESYENLFDGNLHVPWYELSSSQSARQRQLNAALASIRAKQYAKLERWFEEANLPPHQDAYSENLTRHLLPPEAVEIEMGTGKKHMNPEDVGLSDVFDRYSVNLLKRRATVPEDMAHVLYEADDINRVFFGSECIWSQSRLAMDHPVVFVGLDPAGGSLKISDCVIGSAIIQERFTPAALNLIASKRTLQMAKSCYRYFDSTKMQVRLPSDRFFW